MENKGKINNCSLEFWKEGNWIRKYKFDKKNKIR